MEKVADAGHAVAPGGVALIVGEGVVAELGEEGAIVVEVMEMMGEGGCIADIYQIAIVAVADDFGGGAVVCSTCLAIGG